MGLYIMYVCIKYLIIISYIYIYKGMLLFNP